MKNEAEKEANTKLAAKEAQEDRLELITAKQDSAFLHRLTAADKSRPNYLGRYLESLSTHPQGDHVNVRWLEQLNLQLQEELNVDTEPTLQKITETVKRLVADAGQLEDEHMCQLLPALDNIDPLAIITSLLKSFITLKEERDASALVNDIQTLNNLSSTCRMMQMVQTLTDERDAIEGHQRASANKHPCSDSLNSREVGVWGPYSTFINDSSNQALLKLRIHEVHSALYATALANKCNQCAHCRKFLVLPLNVKQDTGPEHFPTCCACISVLYCSSKCRRTHREEHAMGCHLLKYWKEEPNSAHYHAHTMPRSSPNSSGGARPARTTPPPIPKAAQRQGTKTPCQFFNSKQGCKRAKKLPLPAHPRDHRHQRRIQETQAL